MNDKEIVYKKVKEMLIRKEHLESRTYDYGHNDMQTDKFCKFCSTNQANFLGVIWHRERNHVSVNKEWHKKNCIVVVILRNK